MIHESCKQHKCCVLRDGTYEAFPQGKMLKIGRSFPKRHGWCYSVLKPKCKTRMECKSIELHQSVRSLHGSLASCLPRTWHSVNLGHILLEWNRCSSWVFTDKMASQASHTFEDELKPRFSRYCLCHMALSLLTCDLFGGCEFHVENCAICALLLHVCAADCG